MYVLMEYLVPLAAVFLLGLALFIVAVIGLVVQSAVSHLAGIAAETFPKVFTHAAPKGLAALKKSHEGPLVQS